LLAALGALPVIGEELKEGLGSAALGVISFVIQVSGHEGSDQAIGEG